MRTDRELIQVIWSLTWPMIVFNALETLVGLVDLALVRPFGPAATAAVGLGRQVGFLVEALAMAIAAGAITLVSQSVGAAGRASDDRNPAIPAVEAVVRQSLGLAMLLAAPFSLAGYLLSGPLLTGLQASDETFVLGEPYLQTYFAGQVFLWVNLVAVASFRGAGNVWTPLKLALVVSVLHVGLNGLLIYGAGPIPAWGVPGAALGAVIARACGTAVFLCLLWRGSGPLRLRRSAESASVEDQGRPIIGRLLKIGVPMALANLVRHGSRVVFLGLVGATALGVSLHAAVSVGLQVRLIGILLALAFQTATATLVGQAIGRGDLHEAEVLGRRSVQLLAALMAAVSGLLIIAAGPLAACFLDTPAVADLGASVLRWFAVAQFFSALSIGTQGALMGGGDTLPALRYTLLSEWCLMLPATYLLVRLDAPGDALLAVWALSPLLTFLLMQRRFRSGRWKTMASP